MGFSEEEREQIERVAWERADGKLLGIRLKEFNEAAAMALEKEASDFLKWENEHNLDKPEEHYYFLRLKSAAASYRQVR